MDAPVGHANFARLVPCNCKLDEQEERWRKEYTEMSSMDGLEDWSFEQFNPDVAGVREAYETSIEFAQNPDGWLYLAGGYGCGKTHLAAAIANYVLEHMRMRAVFLVVPDLLDHLRSTFAPNQEQTYDSRFNSIRNAGLLVLDDLGTENTTPWAKEKLFQLMNYRYNARRPTVITSNRNFDELDGRIASRISDTSICRTIVMDANDFRKYRGQASVRNKYRRR